jgi:hypothetical protein
MSLQDWRASESRSDRSSSDPSGETAVQSAPSWSRDIKSLLVLILAAVTIGGVMYEWLLLSKHNDQLTAASENAPTVAPAVAPTPTVAPATKLSALFPFCPPERDSCWR